MPSNPVPPALTNWSVLTQPTFTGRRTRPTPPGLTGTPMYAPEPPPVEWVVRDETEDNLGWTDDADYPTDEYDEHNYPPEEEIDVWDEDNDFYDQIVRQVRNQPIQIRHGDVLVFNEEFIEEIGEWSWALRAGTATVYLHNSYMCDSDCVPVRFSDKDYDYRSDCHEVWQDIIKYIIRDGVRLQGEKSGFSKWLTRDGASDD